MTILINKRLLGIGNIVIAVLKTAIMYLYWVEWEEFNNIAYIIHSGFISGYQNRYGDNLKPPTNVYHRMTA